MYKATQQYVIYRQSQREREGESALMCKRMKGKMESQDDFKWHVDKMR